MEIRVSLRFGCEMTIMRQYVKTVTAFSASTRLNNLADGSAVCLGQVDNSTGDYPNAKIQLTINLSTANNPGGQVEIYFVGSLSGTTYTDNIIVGATGNQASKLHLAPRIAALKADADMNSTDITWVSKDLRGLLGSDLPSYWSIVVKNVSGGAFEASGHDANYSLISYQN